MTALAFVVLAAAGATARWRSATAFDRPGGWPAGTLAVHIAGALALGLLVGSDAGDGTLTAVGSGGIGALTTWSGLVAHLADGDRPAGIRAAYAAATLLGGVAAAWVGLVVAG